MGSLEKKGNGTMKLMYIKQIGKERVKIKKIKDYYELFVSMLQTEDMELHTHEHLWVMGIDNRGYAVCVYIVSLGYHSFATVDAMKIFRIALQLDAVKIVMAQSKPNTPNLELTEPDLDLTNAIYHKAKILGLELVDHIVISNLSIDSEKPLYYSYREHGFIDLVEQDITYKSVDEAKEEIDREKEDAIHDRNVEIAKRMLADNEDISKIVKYSDLGREEIERIKNNMEYMDKELKKILDDDDAEFADVIDIEKIKKKN